MGFQARNKVLFYIEANKGMWVVRNIMGERGCYCIYVTISYNCLATQLRLEHFYGCRKKILVVGAEMVVLSAANLLTTWLCILSHHAENILSSHLGVSIILVNTIVISNQTVHLVL